MKPTITAFFTLRRGRWVHDRVREELASYESTSRKRKEAGRKGGSASGGKDKEKSEAIASKKLGNSPHNQNQNQNHSSEGKPSAEVVDLADPGKLAWDLAVQVLQQRGKASESSARSFFGKLLRDNGLEARDLLASVSAAVNAGTSDPQGYLTRAAQLVASRRAPAPKQVSFV